MAGNGLYVKSVDLGASWAALASASMVMNATLVAAAGNAENASVRVDGGTAAAWPPGGRVRLEGVDLSRIEVSGTSGDTFLVAGNTR